MVATCDSHYPKIEDKDVHDIMLCIQTGSIVDDPNRMRYRDDFSLKTVDDMNEAFKNIPEALENTVKIVERCNVDFTFGVNLIPKFDSPDGMDSEEYLKSQCYKGLDDRFKDVKGGIPENYKERLKFELDMVHSMGFDTYFLIVQDFIDYAKEQKIIVGPGRGSAAGSLISYCLGITNVDPLFYGLFFERFLNPERISMPDIDIDFADTRRDEVIKYVTEKYGRENVAQIITFGTMAPRAAIRDVGRALGYPYPEVDALSKMVPPPVFGKNPPLTVCVKEDPTLKEEYESNARSKKLLDLAARIEGTVRHTGTHACAVIISEKKLTNYTALQYGAGSKSEVVTQFSAKPLEKLGLLKMDFLGLRNLTIIETTCKILKRTRSIVVDIDTIPMDDDDTFDVFRRGDTTGVFQFESPGMRRYLRELKPTEFDDIFAMAALYRPGPMEWIPSYISGKHDPKTVKYFDPSFETILSKTYGVAVYQEQILQLARDFAGFSLGEADILRKAVGKKIASLLAEQREKFVKGAVNNGHDEEFARDVFSKVIEPFAGYGFNKAHAVCYGLIAYQTAYLKAHYQIEFMTALLCSDATNTDRVILEINECNEKGISILPPSVNESLSNFTVVGENAIRFGLMAIKGVGEGPVDLITEERKLNGKFESLADFATRVPAKIINKKLIQALAWSGALDEFGDRNKVAESYSEISKFAKIVQDDVDNGQTDIFGIMDSDANTVESITMVDVPPLGDLQNYKWEKELLGMYVSGHPLKGLKSYISKKGRLIGGLTDASVGKTVNIVGMISDLRVIVTKKGDKMAIFTVEDPSGKVRAVMFPKIYAKFGDVIEQDNIVAFASKFDFSRDQYQVSVNTAKKLSINAMIENAREQNTYDEKEEFDMAMRFVDEIILSKKDKSHEELAGNLDIFATTDELCLIKIPKGVKSSKMSELNKILQANKGEKPIDIKLESSGKVIRLPFGVNVSEKLKVEVEKLLS